MRLKDRYVVTFFSNNMVCGDEQVAKESQLWAVVVV